MPKRHPSLFKFPLPTAIAALRFMFTITLLFGIPTFTHADTVYFKDGSITVCRDRAWEEEDKIKCEFYGTVVVYPKTDVDRIEAGEHKEPVEGISEKDESKQKKTAGISEPAKAPIVTEIQRDGGPIFYDPRRRHKYWASESSRHDSLKTAIDALAAKYNRTPEWVMANMGTSNNLENIHQNLSGGKPAPVQTPKEKPAAEKPEIGKLKGLIFYDPRRAQKYWASATSRHDTFGSAIESLSRQYSRPPEWVKANMGNTNSLMKLHQNLSKKLDEETTQ